MRIGGSLALIAIGAVLKWAVTYRTSDVNISMVGTIVLIVGVVGLILSLILAAVPRRTDIVRRTDVVDHER